LNAQGSKIPPVTLGFNRAEGVNDQVGELPGLSRPEADNSTGVRRFDIWEIAWEALREANQRALRAKLRQA
jgi:hypothetical protein